MVVVRVHGPFDHERSLRTLQAVAELRVRRGIPSLVWDARRRTSQAGPEDVRSLVPYLDSWSRVAVVAHTGPQYQVARMAAGLTGDRVSVCPDTKGALRWVRAGQRCEQDLWSEPAEASATPARILVIDDDPAIRRTVSRILSLSGFQVVEAGDGKEGVEALARGDFALVITDLLMPGVEGIETIQTVRETQPTVPIIAISGSFGDDHFTPLDDAKLMGADLALAKPFTVEKLLSAVHSVLGRGT